MMIKRLISTYFLFSFFIVYSQQRTIPLNSFYKDQIFSNKLETPYLKGSFFPVVLEDYHLIKVINDSTKQYYDITHILFQKHLIELKEEEFFMTIDPIIDFTIGKNFSDTTSRRIFQNTRGLNIQGDIKKNFFFSASIYENQSRFNPYETAYYKALGELYPGSDSSYHTQNAVVPGLGRTKPFKIDAFDYASSSGFFVYKPTSFLRIFAGNNQQFIGDGHRSLLLSDNSFHAPYFRIDWTISLKFLFSYMRAKHLNLLRKPVSSSVESYYEPKGFSINYFTFLPNKKISLSLFEGSSWNRGDSIISKKVHPLFYNPIPFISFITLQGKEEVSTVFGVNLSWQIAKKHRIYGQFGLTGFEIEKNAVQIGYRGYDYFNLKDFMLQVEYNHVEKGMYEFSNRRLDYSHFNLPLAHIKGNGFDEILVRCSYEKKRVYATTQLSYYTLKSYNERNLLSVYESNPQREGRVMFSSIEAGYRFNRKINLKLFLKWIYRTEKGETILPTNSISIGLKTGIFNSYKGF